MSNLSNLSLCKEVREEINEMTRIFSTKLNSINAKINQVHFKIYSQPLLNYEIMLFQIENNHRSKGLERSSKNLISKSFAELKLILNLIDVKFHVTCNIDLSDDTQITLAASDGGQRTYLSKPYTVAAYSFGPCSPLMGVTRV